METKILRSECTMLLTVLFIATSLALADNTSSSSVYDELVAPRPPRPHQRTKLEEFLFDMVELAADAVDKFPIEKVRNVSILTASCCVSPIVGSLFLKLLKHIPFPGRKRDAYRVGKIDAKRESMNEVYPTIEKVVGAIRSKRLGLSGIPMFELFCYAWRRSLKSQEAAFEHIMKKVHLAMRLFDKLPKHILKIAPYPGTKWRTRAPQKKKTKTKWN